MEIMTVLESLSSSCTFCCSREQDTPSCLVAGTVTLTHTWCHSASPFGVSRHLGDTSSEKAGQSLERVVSLDPSPPLPSGVSDVAICQTKEDEVEFGTNMVHRLWPSWECWECYTSLMIKEVLVARAGVGSGFLWCLQCDVSLCSQREPGQADGVHGPC